MGHSLVGHSLVGHSVCVYLYAHTKGPALLEQGFHDLRGHRGARRGLGTGTCFELCQRGFQLRGVLLDLELLLLGCLAAVGRMHVEGKHAE